MSDERPAVVVFGATGNQGSNVIKHLHAAGWADIYAVTRDVTTERAQQVRGPSITFVLCYAGLPSSLNIPSTRCTPHRMHMP